MSPDLFPTPRATETPPAPRERMTYAQAFARLAAAILGGRQHWGELVILVGELKEALK